MADRRLGKGFGATQSGKGVRAAWSLRKKKGLGARKPGGGRPDEFGWAKQQCKEWLEFERSHGHLVMQMS